MTDQPTASELMEYVQDTSDLHEIEAALIAETAAQAAVCRVDPYTEDLAEALRRRVARNLAMRNLPLGIQMNEMTSTRVAINDPDVKRLEAPYRRWVIA